MQANSKLLKSCRSAMETNDKIEAPRVCSIQCVPRRFFLYLVKGERGFVGNSETSTGELRPPQLKEDLNSCFGVATYFAFRQGD